ncbi:TetR family transcriptional regulator [Streptomyces mobaraensis NBRC 13819 = DSM 40847]|uniref:TetR/AcrR family transcriptional regulator n=2 Tax=Streptomyces mobaraensis TaxID=35621 RepID=A0A5N5WDQ9_STRMB|nr:TetR family transcriptional regulator [Streptomyces mobaraensis]EMF02585.1 TetR family transcriptional regulator [Streptomyces mobaraensis NBRC 13819 = DSM 40847]KAB7851070.1 TetR/AcrR family transcriptional regulator [Streptomyces mobaraensis]QTT75619.1 TetR family transcriptional regulator [Streptomyces mobaraensis NBRC 13819 = DSM 40847]
MPAARELLLDAAYTALGIRPWHGVRMVDVAAAAGVSRQTLYNEFGSKDGLARALVRREAESFLAGVERSLADAVEREDADAGDCCAAAAVWTLRTARANPLVRAALTGCRGERLPAQAAPAVPAPRTPPPPMTARSAPTPAALVERITGSAAGAAGEATARTGRPPDPDALRRACEAAVRMTLSYVVAPAGSDTEAAEEVAGVVRTLLGGGRE